MRTMAIFCVCVCVCWSPVPLSFPKRTDGKVYGWLYGDGLQLFGFRWFAGQAVSRGVLWCMSLINVYFGWKLSVYFLLYEYV